MSNSSGLASKWRERLARYQAGRAWGTTIAKFCRQEGVSTSAFYLWQRKLSETQRKLGGTQRKPGRAPRRPEAIADRRGDFAAVRLIGTSNVVAQLPGGTRLEIPMSDSDVFERAIRALMRVDAQCGPTRDERGTPC